MKKIKKIDAKTAQSIVSFACPCVDPSACITCSPCGCWGASSATSQANKRTSLLNATNHGSQTINYY